MAATRVAGVHRLGLVFRCGPVPLSSAVRTGSSPGGRGMTAAGLKRFPAATSARPLSSSPSCSPRPVAKVLFDSECKLCMSEISILQKRDTAPGAGHMEFIDIADDSFDPAAHGGVAYKSAMSTMHVLLPDGTVLTGAAAMRQMYTLSGGVVFGTLSRILSIPGIDPIANAFYGIWARHRLSITGRPELDELIRLRVERTTANGETCDATTCGPKV